MSAAKKRPAQMKADRTTNAENSLIHSEPDVKVSGGVRWPPEILAAGMGVVRALAERQAHLGHVHSMLEYMAVEARLRQAACHD